MRAASNKKAKEKMKKFVLLKIQLTTIQTTMEMSKWGRLLSIDLQ